MTQGVLELLDLYHDEIQKCNQCDLTRKIELVHQLPVRAQINFRHAQKRTIFLVKTHHLTTSTSFMDDLRTKRLPNCVSGIPWHLFTKQEVQLSRGGLFKRCTDTSHFHPFQSSTRVSIAFWHFLANIGYLIDTRQIPYRSDSLSLVLIFKQSEYILINFAFGQILAN